MIGPSGAVRVMVATKPVDFRKGAEGLAGLVRETMQADPFSGAIYVFRAKRADRIKLIFWDGTGVCLFAKRLEDGEFRWPEDRGWGDEIVGGGVFRAARRSRLAPRSYGQRNADADFAGMNCDTVNQVVENRREAHGKYGFLSSMTTAIEMLPNDPNELKAMLVAERVRNERLVQIIKELQRHRFGRRAETLPEDQMLLALEEVEQTEAGAAAETEAKSAAEA